MKKIATVSVLAIMAVSAARADIASTTYVDKTAAGAVTTGLSATGNITAAITAATNDKATKTQVAEDIATAVTDMATKTWVTTDATAAQAKADASGQVITATYATKAELNKVAAGELTIQPEAVGTTELANGSVTEVKLNKEVTDKYVDTDELNTALQPYANNTAGYQNANQVSTAISTATTAADGVIKLALDGKVDDSEIVDMAKKSDIGKGTLTVTIDGANAGTFNANAADSSTIAIAVPDTYVNETELGTALAPYAKTSEVAGTYATQQALTTGLGGKVDNATLNNYYTQTAADAKFIDGTELEAATVANAGHATTADSATKATKDGADNVITETYATKTEAAGYIDPDELNTALADYSTTTQMNTELAKKLDDTAAGSATLPIYIDANGEAKTITSYSGRAATAGQADSATTATNYDATNGTIKTKFESVDSALENVAAFGEVPEVPDECKTTDPNGNATMDCTLVMKYNPGTSTITPTWTKVAY